jgi:thiol-disulfide isomerase/thioredoxin
MKIISILITLLSSCLSFKEWWEGGAVPDLTDQTFFDVVGKDKWVLVKFFTTWCGYCRLMAPEYDKLYETLKEKRPEILVYRIECEKNFETPGLYGIRSYPKLVLFKPDQPNIYKIYKYQRTEAAILSWIEQVVPKETLKVLDDSTKAVNKTENITKVNNQDSEDIAFLKDEIKYLNTKLLGLEKELETIKNTTLGNAAKPANNKPNLLLKDIRLQDVIFIGVLVFILIAAVFTIRRIYKKL